MKTRRIYGKKNKTVSKRNKKNKKLYTQKKETRKGGRKRVYRRKTMKGGVTTPAHFNRSPQTNPREYNPHEDKLLHAANKKIPKPHVPRAGIPYKTPGAREQARLDVVNKANNALNRYKDTHDENERNLLVKQENKKLENDLDFYQYKLLTPEIKDVSIITALELVFEKYPITRFSSYFGKNTGTRQQTNIQSLTGLLNEELCGLDTDPETGNCTTGFTADQWANSKYCKANYKAKSGLRYWDTGNKLCEYIPYAMKQLEKDYYTQNKSVGILLFKKKDTGFYFEWAYKYADLLTKEIVNIPVPTVLQLVFKKNPIKRFSGYFGTDVQARQLQNIAAEKMSSDLCNADNNYFVSCTTGFTADQWANSRYCSQNKGNKLCEYIPYAMKQIEKDYFVENNSGEILLFKKKDSTNELAFEWMMTPYEKLINYMKKIEPTTVEQVNEKDCLTKMPDDGWKLQRDIKIFSDDSENTDTVSIRVTVPIFAAIYNAYYSKIKNIELSNPYSILNEYTTEINNVLNSCAPPSENQECAVHVPNDKIKGIYAIIHQISRNMNPLMMPYATYVVTNDKFAYVKDNTSTSENTNGNGQTAPVDEIRTRMRKDIQQYIQQTWDHAFSPLYTELATQNNVCNQRLIFVLYLLPFFYELVNEDTQILITRGQTLSQYGLVQINKSDFLSVFEKSNMYDFFVDKITETQGVSPDEPDAVINHPKNNKINNDHYNLFIKSNGTTIQFTFYAMFCMIDANSSNAEEPLAYCLSELMFSVDLNDPNFDQHFSPSKSLVDCSKKNQDYYANYPKISINNYIRPYK